MADVAQLDYAPTNRSRRRWCRAILGLVLISAIACAGMWSYRFAQQMNYSYHQSKCMNWTAPATRSVCEEFTATGTRNQSIALRSSWYTTPFPELAGAWFDTPRDACVFLHSRRTSEGPRRLVTVTTYVPLGGGCAIEAASWIPATLVVGSRLQRTNSFATLQFPKDRSFCLFAGQPDPADESHFTISYEINGQSGLIDGWLRPDDVVKLEPRDGPLRR